MRVLSIIMAILFTLTPLAHSQEKPSPGADELRGLDGEWKGPPAAGKVISEFKGHLWIKINLAKKIESGLHSMDVKLKSDTDVTAIGTHFAFEIEEKNKSRFLVLFVPEKGEMVRLRVQFELKQDTLKLTFPKKIYFPIVGNEKPFDLSGEWQRVVKGKPKAQPTLKDDFVAMTGGPFLDPVGLWIHSLPDDPKGEAKDRHLSFGMFPDKAQQNRDALQGKVNIGYFRRFKTGGSINGDKGWLPFQLQEKDGKRWLVLRDENQGILKGTKEVKLLYAITITKNRGIVLTLKGAEKLEIIGVGVAAFEGSWGRTVPPGPSRQEIDQFPHEAPEPGALATEAARQFAKALKIGYVEVPLKVADVPFLPHKTPVLKEMASLKKHVKGIMDEIRAGKLDPKALDTIRLTVPYEAVRDVEFKDMREMADQVLRKQDWVVIFYPASQEGETIAVLVKVNDGSAKVVGFVR